MSFSPSFSRIRVFSSSFPPPCLPSSSHSLFSSSSSAADCCPSYLCSRLGMFFLLMTSILSPALPTHSPYITFCFLSGLPTCPCFLSVSPHPSGQLSLCHSGWGLGWRQGCAMISYSAAGHGEAFLGCLMLFGWGSCPSLCPLKTTAGRRRVKLLLTSVPNCKSHRKPELLMRIESHSGCWCDSSQQWCFEWILRWRLHGWMHHGGHPGQDPCMIVLWAPSTACAGYIMMLCCLYIHPSVPPSVCDQLSLLMFYF